MLGEQIDSILEEYNKLIMKENSLESRYEDLVNYMNKKSQKKFKLLENKEKLEKNIELNS